MVEHLLIFFLSLFLVAQGATLATKYSAELAKSFNLSKYIVGFIVVAFISILPEALISINSALEGIPAFGLGTLFGSNVADLTLIFAILIIYARRGLYIESKVLKDVSLYPLFLILPIVFGLNGYYSRVEGAFLIVAGAIFYYMVFKNGIQPTALRRRKDDKFKNVLLLLIAMVLLLVGANFTVASATSLAQFLNISPILIGMLVVSLGTTMPELFYSLKSIKRKNDDGLAIGDILGTVLADATIVVGIITIISPFSFPVSIVYVSGTFMVIASLILLKFMRSGRVLTVKEGYLLLMFWLAYAVMEIMVNIAVGGG